MLMFAKDDQCIAARAHSRRAMDRDRRIVLKALVYQRPHAAHPLISSSSILFDDDGMRNYAEEARRRGYKPLYVVRVKRWK